jgi:hypothetical protein
MLARVDSSLVEAWADLFGARDTEEAAAAPPRFDLAADARAFTARVRSEMLGLVAGLSRGHFEEALDFVRDDPDDPWGAERLENELAPFFEEYGEIVFAPEARRAHHTLIRATAPRTWDVSQVLVDPAGDNLWAIHGEVDLRTERDPEGPLVHVRRIGT